jgi:hypothetical protein
MKLDPVTRKKICRDASLSLFIYALPALLMFLSFYLTGNTPGRRCLNRQYKPLLLNGDLLCSRF